MRTNGGGLDDLIGAGSPAEPLEEQQVRARLRRSLFGVRVDPVKLGRFTVLERLGSGGAGVVYAAWDPQLDRKVALKVLRAPDELDADEPQLVREAKALAKLAHPNVVSVFDVALVSDAEDPTIRLVLAMEYVEGQTVSAWLRQDERSWQEVVRVFLAAGQGLAAAHAVGLIHRDFKPSNVVVGTDGRVRVLDFGLARTLTATPETHSDTTQSSETLVEDGRSVGRIAGTPAYMAPEQHRGEPWDPRMDQYAFCVALFEALEGTPPFASAPLDVLYSAKVRGPPNPKRAGPSHLRKILARGLQPDPSERFASMEALLDVLRIDPQRRRRRRVAVAGVAALTGVGSYLAWSSAAQGGCTGGAARLEGLWDSSRRALAREAFATSGRLHAETSWQTVEASLDTWVGLWSKTHRDACRAHGSGEQSSELLDLRMSCLDGALRELRASTDVLVNADETVVDRGVAVVSALPELDRCSDTEALLARRLDPIDPAAAIAVERVREAIADALAEQAAGHYARAFALAESALAKAEPLGHRSTIASARFALGSALDRMADPEPARKALLRAAQDAQAVGDDHLLARAANVLVWVVGDRLGRFDEAHAWAGLAEGTIERLGGDVRLVADLHAARGVLAFNEGRYDEAIAHHEDCVTASAAAWKAEHYKTFICHINLANVHNRRGDAAQALTAYRHGIEIAVKSLGEAHPHTLTARGNVLGVLEQLGRNAEALEEGAMVLERQRAVLGPEHPALADTLVNMASSERASGNLDQAVVLAERALTIQENAWGPDHFWLATTLVNIAQYRLEQGDPEHAAIAAERALELQRSALGDDHGDVAHALMVLGRIELARGNVVPAREHLERARALAREAYGKDHFLVGIADAHLAQLPGAAP